MKFSDERIQKMLRGRREVARIPVPGFEGVEAGVRVLTEAQLDDARCNAIQHVETIAKRLSVSAEVLTTIDPELFDAEVTRQIVYRAFVDPDTASDAEPKPFFEAPQTLRQLDAALVRALMDAYLEHQDVVSPLRHMTQVEIDELVRELGKEHAPLLWSALGPDTQRRFVFSMAAQLATLRQSKSSGG